MGAKNKAIGVVAGVSDLIHIAKKGTFAYELKIRGSRHKIQQLKKEFNFLKASCENAKYFSGFLIDNEEIAKLVIDNANKGRKTNELEYLSELSIKNFFGIINKAVSQGKSTAKIDLSNLDQIFMKLLK